MKFVSFPLAALLLTVPVALAPVPLFAQESEASRAADEAPPSAAYSFALAKMLAAEGEATEAERTFRRAVAAAPDDPYLLIEFAAFLVEQAQGERRATRERAERLAEAVELATRARDAAPDEVEAWRVLAEAHLALAAQEPSAVEAAVAAFERVHALAPADLQAAVTLGQLYMSLERSGQAADVFQRVAEAAPGNRYVYDLLANALAMAGRRPEAEEVLTRILAMDPAAREARLTLARFQSERGQHEAALATLEAAPESQRRDPEVARLSALELSFVGRPAAALERIETLLAEGRNPRLLAVKALILAEQGDDQALLAVLDEIGAGDPYQRELARLLARGGEAEEAERVLARVLERLEGGEEAEPRVEAQVRMELAALRGERGDAAAAAAVIAPLTASRDAEVAATGRLLHAGFLSDAGRTDEALAVLDQGRATPQREALVLEVLLDAGRERGAQRVFERLAERDDDTRLLAAEVAASHQRYDLAIPLLEELTSRSPVPDGLFLLGSAYERTGRIDEAVGTFRRLLATSPDHAPALNYLGYLWADRNENLEEALELLHRAVALRPEDGAYLDSLGWVLHRLGRDELALKYLQQAAAQLSDDPTVLEHLGDVYLTLGDGRQAREAYLRALARLDQPGSAETPGQLDAVRRKLEQLPRE
ncbi:MAG TPA: tetratricopeptide repeat protein [Thermoanaerobaculia bacterium]|nr:tetratricopeptide repeat protein [Thermoanaerobaculia bacterium]